MAYSGWRNIDLIGSTLPSDKQILAILAVIGGIEGGLIYWSYSFMWEARGTPQKSISAAMAIVCFLGMGAGIIADTFLEANRNLKLAQSDLAGAYWAISLVIIANIGAKFLFEACEPTRSHASAEEELEDDIHLETLKELRKGKQKIALSLAKEISQARFQQIAEKLRAHYQVGEPAPQLPPPSIEIVPVNQPTNERPGPAIQEPNSQADQDQPAKAKK